MLNGGGGATGTPANAVDEFNAYTFEAFGSFKYRGFSILSEKNRPLVTLSFETQGEAEQARAEIVRAVEKAVEVTPQG